MNKFLKCIYIENQGMPCLMQETLQNESPVYVGISHRSMNIGISLKIESSNFLMLT
jgi:hypothetical protein